MAMLRVLAILGVAAGWACQAAAEEFTATVTAVASGRVLTLSHDGQEERAALAGLRTPWTTSTEGKQAKTFSSEHAFGKTVQVRVIRREDKLVYVTVQLPTGEDLGELLLAAGLASWDGRFEMDVTRYRNLEDQAKEKRIGIWANYTPSSAPGPGGDATDLPKNDLPKTMVRRDALSKDYNLQAAQERPILESREIKRASQLQQRVSNEQQITQQGYNRRGQARMGGNSGYGGFGGYGMGGRWGY